MNNLSTNSVIPEGELRCVWMDAGITNFKLCDQEYRCKLCIQHNHYSAAFGYYRAARPERFAAGRK